MRASIHATEKEFKVNQVMQPILWDATTFTGDAYAPEYTTNSGVYALNSGPQSVIVNFFSARDFESNLALRFRVNQRFTGKVYRLGIGRNKIDIAEIMHCEAGDVIYLCICDLNSTRQIAVLPQTQMSMSPVVQFGKQSSQLAIL